MDQVPQFSSKDEEIQYWKCLAMQYQKGMQEAREELDEFQENSRELEQELEAQLDQVDQRNRDLCSINNRLQLELEATRDKLDQVQKDTEAQISDIQAQLSGYRSREDEWHRYIRELEQANDDLERAKRAMLVSVEDFESRLNLAIERNAFLESELDEKESLRTMVQRLKDEARDMKQELQVRERDVPEEKCIDRGRSNGIDSNKFTVEMETQTAMGSPLKTTHNNASNSSPLTPSARISTMNIVGDLIRKTGALESKLASFRNIAKDSPQLGEFPNKEVLSWENYVLWRMIAGFPGVFNCGRLFGNSTRAGSPTPSQPMSQGTSCPSSSDHDDNEQLILRKVGQDGVGETDPVEFPNNLPKGRRLNRTPISSSAQGFIRI